MVSSEVHPQKDSERVTDNRESDSNKSQITAEQKARMEASRLKALERIATRAHSSAAP